MASSHPENDDHQPVEDRELERIINILAFSREHALTQVNNSTRNLEALCIRASVNLVRYAASQGHYISVPEVNHILHYLMHALEQFRHAQTQISLPLRDAERNARRALSPIYMRATSRVLDNLRGEALQRMLIAGRQSNLWRHVACRQTNTVLPQNQVLLLDHAIASAILIDESRDSWEVARNILETHMNVAKESLKEVLQLLAIVFYRTGNVTNCAIQEVHNILAAVADILAAIDETILVSFQQAASSLEALSNSARAECFYVHFPQM